VSQAKINHGFWDTWRTVEELRTPEPDISPAELDRAVRRRFMVEGGFLDEMEEVLKKWRPPPGGPYLSCSADAFPGEDRMTPVPRTPREGMEDILARKAPSFSLNSGGLVWKKAVLDGSIGKFLRAIGDQQVIVVGPPHLRVHEQIWRWPDVHFEEIHPTDARKDRHAILQRLERILASQQFSTVLLQCGSLSAWMVSRLHRPDANYCVFDLGRALDFVDPDKSLSQPWGAVHARTLAWHYGPEIEPWRAWLKKWLIEAPSGPDITATTHSRPIPFIEKKRIDFPLLEKRLAESEASGHWANFGPAVSALETRISARQALDDNVVPITTASGTAALWVAAGVAALHHGGPIRWVVSSFGFFSSALGPLAAARILDCDPLGMLSMSALEMLDDSEYDGIIVTDLFGRSDITRYVEFSRAHGKHLIIDAAAGWGREMYRTTEVPAAFSFHHTKPYGFGEGGCLFVERSDAGAARSITNYGHDLPAYLQPYCGNWKLSDAQAALIETRHANAPFWGPRYRLQYLRLRQIAVDLGLNVLGSSGPIFGDQSVAPPASIALLMDSAISQEVLNAAALPFVARKYYRPLKETAEARVLYDRIVCIPTHPDMAELDNATIRDGISRLVTIQETPE